MKKATLKIVSSLYIVLISFLLIVMTTYAWTVFSKSPENTGSHLGVGPSGTWLNDAKDGYVAQVGNRWYPTVAQALAKSEGENVSIQLINDCIEDIVVPSGKTVLIDLNGYTMTNVAADTLFVEQGATLIISDTSADKKGVVDNLTHKTATLFNRGNVLITGGTFTRSAETSTTTESSDGNSYYNIVNQGIMQIDDATVVSCGAFSSLIENGYYDITGADTRLGYAEGINHPTPTLTIDGGEFSGGINTVKNDDGGVLLINNGSFINFVQAAVYNTNKAEITGGYFNAENPEGYSLINCNYTVAPNICSVEIKGGSFTGAMKFGTFTQISGGYFTVSVDGYVKEGFVQERLYDRYTVKPQSEA